MILWPLMGSAGITDIKFGRYQIADSQWNVTSCLTTTTCQIYSKNPGTAYQIPWSNGQLVWATGDYVQLSLSGNASYPYTATQYDSGGNVKVVMGNGKIVSMSADYFFFVGSDNNTGQLFSGSTGMSGTGGVTWTGTLNPTVTQANTYASASYSLTPLAAGQAAVVNTASNITAVGNPTAIGTTLNPKLDGGTLKATSSATHTANIAITANKGYLDQNDLQNTYSGIFSDESNAATGRLVVLNSAVGRVGFVRLTGLNTHTGGTEVQAGATLQIASASALGTGRLDLVGSLTESATLSVTASTTISNSITVAGDPTFDIASGTTTTISGVISDGASPGDVVKIGAGTLVLTAANTYTGPTIVSQGILTVSGGLSDSTAVTVSGGATYNVNASDTIGSLAGAGTVSSTNEGAKVLTVGADNNSTTFSGVIQNGTGSLGLTKTGTGTLTLSGANTYTGATAIGTGVLKLSGSGTIAGSTAVTNNATFDITQASGSVSLGGTYTQGASGILKMALAPVTNQQVNLTGAASLNGTLNLTASAGTYRAGRYTLITSAGLGGSTFSTLSTNLASVTSYGYSLAYDASNVYLELRSSAADTLASIQAMGADLNKVYNAQYGIAQQGLSYDCKLFDEKNLCLSAGARTTHSRADGSTYDGVALIAAYRLQPDWRLGGWIDQNASRKMVLNVTAGNSTPMLGAFAVWNENPQTGQGLEVKLSAAYGQKDLALTRPVVGTSERGQGHSKLSTLVAEASVGYGIRIDERTSVSPFAGLRHARLSNTGYTEGSDIFSPLGFAKTRQSATSLIAGVTLHDKPAGPVGLDLSAGVERYLSTSPAQLSATGIDNLGAVQMTPVLSKNRPFASASLRHDIAKNQHLLFGLSHSKQFANSDWVTSATVRYVIGL